ncbi:MAG: hypothetical protein MUF05_02635 [Candidatus Omnitrophica bacterium]|jgi:hypothetical protein|nr:hypothetical protein [Candidatus Omnitrophota bacterium]
MKKPSFQLSKTGEFVITNYNHAKPFANFFPAIAGCFGIPIWVFYVNRGQCIASLGTKDKDHAIMEFSPANKAWQHTSLQGFRTFLKISRGKSNLFYEPFHNGFSNLPYTIENKMKVSSYGLKIEETNYTLGVQTEVEYFTLPNDSFGALVRAVTIRNISKRNQHIQMLDGASQIIPFGMNNWLMKEMSRTIEAWMVVDNLKQKAAFLRLLVDPSDRPEVTHIKEGNFYFGATDENSQMLLLDPIVDPDVIFAEVTDFSCPASFLRGKDFLPDLSRQAVKNKIPCGFIHSAFNLKTNEDKIFYSMLGYAFNVDALNKALKRMLSPGYLSRKRDENQAIISGITQMIETKSSSLAFDFYAKQTFLDNIMRGGLPLTLETGDKKHIFYLYSRKHGDLERDYNRFQIQPTYFSQGNGNYRDINQNRRLDCWFNPLVKENNIVSFLNLIQTDGFNPLVVKGVSFLIQDQDLLRSRLKSFVRGEDEKTLIDFFAKPFTPGDLAQLILEKDIKLFSSLENFIGQILSLSVEYQEAEHGEGFWIDHWAYNLDLLENYFSMYPEDKLNLCFEKKIFTFFDNSEVVKPRAEKYLLYHGQPRQLHCVGVDSHKKELIKKRHSLSHAMHSGYGTADIYTTSLFAKLLCLFVNKMSSLDPFGAGIEMEANKPGWYDALNGLPALFGSSSCETFELKRLILFLKDIVDLGPNMRIQISEEVIDFIFSLDPIIKESLQSDSNEKDYVYWDKATSLKEAYRKKTILGFSGNDIQILAKDVLPVLDNALKKIDSAINKAYDPKAKMYYAYFMHEVVEFSQLEHGFIKPLKFRQIRLPFFLESQVHALRLASDEKQARQLHQAVMKSALYDNKLKMYKVNAPLSAMPEEIGRCRVFTPGWLENESIWLHMEYKYLLELLKQGLYDEFYADFKNVLIPFLDPFVYGRSILENSSFIVGSAYFDKKLHGAGFVARLSGSTAEFLQIWLLINTGKQPFFMDNKGQLALRFQPALEAWMFDKKTGSYSFKFLNKTMVTYHNPKRKNTFGANMAQVKKITFLDKNAKLIEIESSFICPPYAEQIRSCQIGKIDIYLG